MRGITHRYHATNMMKVSMNAIEALHIDIMLQRRRNPNTMQYTSHKEEHNIVDQKRPTTKEIGEHSDIETKNRNFPSILGLGPIELRF